MSNQERNCKSYLSSDCPLHWRHEVGIASNRVSARRGEYMSASRTHRPSRAESRRGRNCLGLLNCNEYDKIKFYYKTACLSLLVIKPTLVIGMKS